MSTAQSQPSDTECPNCGGRLCHDPSRGETACPSCGHIASADAVDTGPEWREFHPEDREKRRTGPARTVKRHDRGLSTTLQNGSHDSRGKQLSEAKQRKFARLRTQQSRADRSSREFNMMMGFREIARMQSALGLPDSIENLACSLYRQVVEDGLLIGYSIEGMSTATLYIAYRMQEGGITLSRLETYSHVTKEDVLSCRKKLKQELDLPIPPPVAQDFIPHIVSELDLSAAHRQRAKEALDSLSETDIAGYNPRGIAAAAVYVTQDEDRVLQTEICDIADISTRTLSKNLEFFNTTNQQDAGSCQDTSV